MNIVSQFVITVSQPDVEGANGLLRLLQNHLGYAGGNNKESNKLSSSTYNFHQVAHAVLGVSRLVLELTPDLRENRQAVRTTDFT